MPCSSCSRTVTRRGSQFAKGVSRRISALPLRRCARQGKFLMLGLLLFPLVALVPAPGYANASPRAPGSGQPRALVLEPFATDLGDGPGPGQDVVNALQGAGYAVTVLLDVQVTVSVMRSLSRYAFIYISTHAGPLPNNDAAVATGDTRHHKFSSYLANYSLAEMRIASGGANRYFDAVTGRFIHRYDGVFPAHSIIFLNACNTLDMPLFWRYLRASGVGTLISWHHHVTSVDADRAAEAMLAALAAGKNISQALSATTAAGADTSVVKNKRGWLSFSGDGMNTLQQAPATQDPGPPASGRGLPSPSRWPANGSSS